MHRGAWFVATLASRLRAGRRRLRRRRQRRAAASSSSGGGSKAGKVAVLLPDSKSSVRWETVDRPFLKKAFDAAGVESDDHERRGRQVHAAAAGRAGDHERREGAPAREPRLGLGRGDRGQRQVARASRSSTTTA